MRTRERGEGHPMALYDIRRSRGLRRVPALPVLAGGALARVARGTGAMDRLVVEIGRAGVAGGEVAGQAGERVPDAHPPRIDDPRPAALETGHDGVRGAFGGPLRAPVQPPLRPGQ